MTLLVLLLGACVGSFLNVVIWRLPRQESLIRPGSHCPSCGSPLGWLEKLPLLGWLLLRGRCRHCRTSISWRYPAVELLVALLGVLALAARPDGLGAAPPAGLVVVGGWLLAALAVVLALIDVDHLWLPEPLCRAGVVLGLAVVGGAGFAQGPGIGREVLLAHLLAAGVGLLAMEGLAAIAETLLGRPALGLGDAKLAAMIGAWLGPLGLPVALALAVSAGAVTGLLGRLSGRLGPLQPLPFGPFLLAGCLITWYGGSAPWLALVGL